MLSVTEISAYLIIIIIIIIIMGNGRMVFLWSPGRLESY